MAEEQGEWVLRNRNLRAAALYRYDFHGRGERNFSDRDRDALGYSRDGELSAFGPGGYPNAYYPCDISGENLDGESFCAQCATEWLKQDSQNAVLAHCHINGWPEREGERCSGCGEWIAAPLKDAIVVDISESGKRVLIALTNGEPENNQWLTLYPKSYLEDWCNLEGLYEEFGNSVYDLYSEMPY
jgi:hypothetical protein